VVYGPPYPSAVLRCRRIINVGIGKSSFQFGIALTLSISRLVCSHQGHTSKFQEWTLELTDLGSLLRSQWGKVIKKGGDEITLAGDTKKNWYERGNIIIIASCTVQR
jgi:hypothetical protein